MEIDWLELRVTKKFRQQCIKCNLEAYPYFEDVDQAFEDFFKFLMQPSEKRTGLEEHKMEKNHEYALCEVCGFGRNPRHH